MRSGAACLGCIGAALAVACGSGSGNPGALPDSPGSSSGARSTSSGGSSSSGSSRGGSSSGFGTFGGDAAADASSTSCSGEAADYVYVLSAQNDLYRFAPDKKQFTKIGPLGCNTTMQPNSMAVDRNAVAYVDYFEGTTAGAIYQVSTQDASCKGLFMTMPAGWYQVGMGYAANGPSTNAETLYVAAVFSGGGSNGLGRVDMATKTVVPVGSFTAPLAGQNAELTGTGDARLYGFFTTSPVEVAQIDPMTGATQTPVPMTGVATPLDWAFSFWGGHFYLYTSQGAGSSVADYDPTTGSVNPSYVTGLGFDIVGAGVSTCAPVTPPQ
jgi:hypothetical protein